MDVLVQLVVPLFFAGLLLLLGRLVGSARERRHEHELDVREAAMRASGFLVSELRAVPGWAVDGTLVAGSAVIASDYFKTFAGGLRGIVGGEVRSFQTLLTRARREALMRAVEDAQARGANGLLNLRFETSDIASGASRSNMIAVEVVCYGTAVQTDEARRVRPLTVGI